MAFARDLGALVDAIAGPLADLDPAVALVRMLDFVALTPSIFERSDDDGTIGDQFQAACVAVATLIERTPPGPAIEDLARRGYALYLAVTTLDSVRVALAVAHSVGYRRAKQALFYVL